MVRLFHMYIQNIALTDEGLVLLDNIKCGSYRTHNSMVTKFEDIMSLNPKAAYKPAQVMQLNLG